MTDQSIMVSNNQPVELFDARSRIAHLEAKIEQADYLLGGALTASVDYEDMLRKVEMAQRTLKEALGQERELLSVT